ncbi:MAG: alcohol dehydrogenase [Chitinophagaceae bacterium]|nr:alcohol dehydrogenase [Chitinophagaceae bacterium]
MDTRPLGNSGISIRPFILGSNVFGWTIDEKKSFEVLDAFAAAGFSMIDTADIYSRWGAGNKGGESETIIGKWLKQSGKRSQMVIATKVGGDMGQGKVDLSRGYIIKAVEDSLRRLRTDVIDLYQSHFDDAGTPFEETLSAFDTLVKQGKVRAVGASNLTRTRLNEALNASEEKKLIRYETLQPKYNLMERQEFEKDLQSFVQEKNIGVIPYYGLASGFLTGKYRTEADLSKSTRGGGVQKYLNAKGLDVLSALDEAAHQYMSTPAQVALAWLMAQPGITAPIASATSAEQLNELLKASDIILSKETIDRLNVASEDER